MQYAHSLPGEPPNKWQSLETHLQNCSTLAKNFALPFESSEWAALLGWFHDCGKARASFQDYIKQANSNNENYIASNEHSHSGVGACCAFQKLKLRGLPLSYCIAGHHAGIPDYIGGVTPNGALKIRLTNGMRTLDEKEVTQWVKSHEYIWPKKLTPPWRFARDCDLSLWIRMLFSCLVDADFLDTENFLDSKKNSERSHFPSLKELAPHFFQSIYSKEESSVKTPVNALRKEIRQSCENAALLSQGIFSLTVPTGGGKTLSATAFALRHALKHDLKRLIYVIPYTSIIEQTANVLRSFFGTNNVIEHHSNLDPDKETLSSRLATENWDAPVIVTTSVQFFESLYSCKPSRCRKLHNIAESIVILDEAQLLPPKFIWPCTEALALLTQHYRTTIVLSTATQPALSCIGPLKPGDIKEIIPKPQDLYKRLKRVDIEFPKDLNKNISWQILATELIQFKQVLCIVNTRKSCRELTEELIRQSQEEVIYLSTWLCGAHRSYLINTIKEKLSSGEKVRVVSTQLVEAGVDFDFPVVYRAFSGFPSIVQAAGRCNREGKIKGRGKVKVFIPPSPSPIGELRKAEDISKRLLCTYPNISLDDPTLFLQFYKEFYSSQNDNGKDRYMNWLVNGCAKMEFQFREASDDFAMIPENTKPVIVKYSGNATLISQLKKGDVSRELKRKLQRYIVNVREENIKKLLDCGLIEEAPYAGAGIYIQLDDSLYSPTFGLNIHPRLSNEDILIFVGEGSMKGFCLEVSGDFACFTRPEMKVERVSYDVITPSAARAIYEAIFWKPAIRWNIRAIEVLKPICWASVRRNEVSKVVQKSFSPIYIETERVQRASLILKDVCYRIFADFTFIPPKSGPRQKENLFCQNSKAGKLQPLNEADSCVRLDEKEAKYAAIFSRRASRGQYFSHPYLGCREFSCSEFRLVTDLTKEPKPIEETKDLGIMLYDMNFSNKKDIHPMFFRAKMIKGVIKVPPLDSTDIMQ